MKLTSISLILLLAFQCVSAQSYHPFLEENKQWAELNVFQTPVPDPQTTVFSTLTYRLAGDTTIEGSIWKKLFYTSSDPVFGNWQQDLCFYREQDRKVYRYYDPLTGEEMLYDFSLSAGDSLFIGDGQPFDYWIHVVQADSVLLNGQMHRRLLFDDPAETWIEGLGSTYRPFDPIYAQFDLGGGMYSLLCVSNQEGQIYQDSLYNGCFVEAILPAGVDKTGNPGPKVTVYHDTETRTLHVKTEGKINEFRHFRLYNTAGAFIQAGEITGNPFCLSSASLETGLYILRISGPEKVHSVRFVVN
ncbi:MAG: T9SS type A sorting domain-containing protein [Bacteroidales bacterium]|nr:T9SS type A sorting domain-containing protein [Bacteroidales bacterium]